MSDRFKLDFLCNSLTPSGSSGPGGGGQLARAIVSSSEHLFYSCSLYFLPFSLFSLCNFLCFFVLFQSYCSHAQVFWITLVHEFHIFYNRPE